MGHFELQRSEQKRVGTGPKWRQNIGRVGPTKSCKNGKTKRQFGIRPTGEQTTLVGRRLCVC